MSAADQNDLSYRQALVYAEELKELFQRNRATAANLHAAREAGERVRYVIE